MCIQSVSRKKKTGKWKIPSITQDEHLGEEGSKNKNRGGMGNVDGDDRGRRKEEIEGKGREGNISMVYFDQCSSGEGKKG